MTATSIIQKAHPGGRGVVYSTPSIGMPDLHLAGMKAGAWSNSVSGLFWSDVKVHKTMLTQSGSGEVGELPIYYVRAQAQRPEITGNSSDAQIGVAAEAYYQAVHQQLADMTDTSKFPEAPVERGAIDTALEVLNDLHNHQLAPPEVTWQGGDAVVMLWQLGSTTYAITVTDGEVGYVVRRDRKRLLIADSINVKEFNLLEFR